MFLWAMQISGSKIARVSVVCRPTRWPTCRPTDIFSDIFSASIDLIARRNNRAPVAQFVMHEIVNSIPDGLATLRVLK